MANVISQIKTPDNTIYDIRAIRQGTINTNTSTSTAFVATAPGVSTLYGGLAISIKNTKIASAANCTLNINGLGAKRIWLSQSNNYCTTHWGLNQSYLFIFDEVNDRWELQQGRDTDGNDTSTLRPYYSHPTTDSNGIKQYSLFAFTNNNKVTSFTTNSGTGAKTYNTTNYFDINKIYYYNGSGNVAANTVLGNNTVTEAVNLFDCRYTFNGITTSSDTSVISGNKPLYLCFDTSGSNGYYKLKSPYFTQTPNATGIIYVLLGYVYDTYRCDLWINNFAYIYNGSALLPFLGDTVIGSGTSGYLTKWNGTNSITNGPQLGSSTTTYLRNDGTWQTPPNDDTKVTQTTDATSSTNGFLLFSGSNNGSTATEGARKSGFLSYRPSEKIASSTGGWESTQQQSGYINYTLASQNEITTKMAASSAPTNWLTETKLSNGFNDSLVGLYTKSGDHYYSEVCPESIQTMGTICSREGYYSDWVEIWYDSEEGTYTYDTQSELMMNRWCENEEDSSTHEITHTWWYEGGFIDAIYPIGAIFITTVNVNPGTYLYGTTWVAFGAGRTIVGVKSSDTDFDTVEKTGGSKKLQEHTHEQQATFRLKGNPNSAASTVYSPGTAISNTSVTEGSGSYSLALRGVDKSNKGYNFKIEGNTKSTGTGDSQNLQPYITVYMWKRTS